MLSIVTWRARNIGCHRRPNERRGSFTVRLKLPQLQGYGLMATAASSIVTVSPARLIWDQEKQADPKQTKPLAVVSVAMHCNPDQPFSAWTTERKR